MAKRRKSKALSTAKQYSDYLLYEITGGNMGAKPEVEVKKNTATFGEKRGLLDSLIKIAALEKEDEGEDDTSGFDKIKREIAKRNQYGSGKNGNTGNTESPPLGEPAHTGIGTEGDEAEG